MTPSTRLPPGLRAPAALQTLRFVTDPLALLDDCSRRFGDTFTLRLVGSGNWVLFSDPAHVKAVFSASPEVARGGEANFAVFGSLTGSTSSLVTDGRPHARRRRLLIPAFAAERMRVTTAAIRDITEANLAVWTAGPFALGPRMKDIAVQVVMRTIFGLDHGAEARALTELLVRLGNAGVASPLLFFPRLQWDLGRYSPWGRIMDLKRRTDTALFAEIARRRAEGDVGRDDVLSLLLHARNDDGEPLTDQELRDELVTLLFAGHETTALALTWAFERILVAPEVRARIEAELVAVLDGRPITADDVPKLAYLDAAVKEALRVRPIGPIAGHRRLTAPLEIAGYQLPAGTIVANCCYLAHRRADVFPEPDRFHPERFLRTKPDVHTWTPFGGGERRCPGANFANHEMKVVLATVLSRKRLTLASTTTGVERIGFFIGPRGGLPIRAADVIRPLRVAPAAPSDLSAPAAPAAPSDLSAPAAQAEGGPC
jgi:cytochrome P450 family 110